MPDLSTLTERSYLGDGVYCGFDGFHVWVWTSDGVRESPAIAFDPDVIESFNAYVSRIRHAKDKVK